MASFYEHIGTEAQDIAEVSALASKNAAEAAAVQAEAAKDSAISSASDASTSESTATAAQNAASASATAAAASAVTSTTKASEASASASTSTSKAAETSAFAASASTSESNSAASSTSASNSSSTANTKAVEAAASAASVLTSENNAATSASTSTTQATNSATSAASSLTAKNASEAAKTAAETAETNAATSETNAASSATAATGSASTATTQAGISTTKASESATSATAAATTLSNITGLSASTGAAGSSAAYDSSTGVLTVPRGDTGATGAAGAAGTQFDTNVLKVDATNNRIGINDTTPSVSIDAGSNTDAIALPAGTTAQRPTGVAGQFRYNSTLDQFEGFTDEWGAISGAVGGSAMAADNFTANGSTTAFQLSQVVSSEDSLIIFIEGVFQQQDAFSIATAGGATTVTFGSAPANARSILIYSISAASLISGSNVNVTSMTGDGSDVTLTLPIAPVANNTQVFISGVYQNKDTYSVSGTTLTFSTAPPSGSEVQVLTLNQTAINVPVDNSITSAKLSGDLTTPGTLTSTGKITADAGIDIDNLNIDGTTIALSSGSMALTTAVNLDLNMTGLININDTSDPPGTGNTAGSISQDTGASIGLTQNDGNLTLRLDKLGKNTVFQNYGASGSVGGYVDSLSLNAYGATVAVPLTVANGLTLTNGNVVVAAGHGIDFSANSSAAGMSSELFDHYEFGTWTPVPKGSTTAGTISIPSGHQTGTYTKIGNIVHISMFLYGTNFTGAGTFQIHGLPFSHGGSSGTLPLQINSPPWNSLPADNQNITGYLSNNTIMTFRATNRNKGGGYVEVTVTSPSTIGYLRVNGTYKTTA